MYFTMSQIQYLGLALFGGLILIAVLALAFWSYRLQVRAGSIERMEEPESEIIEDEDSIQRADFEHQEGRNPMPLIILLLIIGIVVWGIGYTLAHSFGVFYAQ